MKMILPGVAIVHPDPELRGIYARRLRRELAAVEACSDLNALEELLKIYEPRVFLVHLSLLDRSGRRYIKRLRTRMPHLTLITIGDVPENKGFDWVAGAGAMGHVPESAGRVGDVVTAVISASALGI